MLTEGGSGVIRGLRQEESASSCRQERKHFASADCGCLNWLPSDLRLCLGRCACLRGSKDPLSPWTVAL